MPVLNVPPAIAAALLSGKMTSTLPSSAPALSDEQHMDRARIARLIRTCQAWRANGTQPGIGAVAFSSDVAVALLDVVLAQLERREQFLAFTAASSGESANALASLDAANRRGVTTLDQLLDVDAAQSAALAMQQRQQLFASATRRAAERPHA